MHELLHKFLRNISPDLCVLCFVGLFKVFRVLVYRTMKSMKSQSLSPHVSKFQMVKGESVVELEGTVTTPPVLQHAGVSTWPGICHISSLVYLPYGIF